MLLWCCEKPSKSEAIKLERKLKNLSRENIFKFMLKYSEEVPDPEELDFIIKFSGR